MLTCWNCLSPGPPLPFPPPRFPPPSTLEGEVLLGVEPLQLLHQPVRRVQRSVLPVLLGHLLDQLPDDLPADPADPLHLEERCRGLDPLVLPLLLVVDPVRLSVDETELLEPLLRLQLLEEVQEPLVELAVVSILGTALNKSLVNLQKWSNSRTF